MVYTSTKVDSVTEKERAIIQSALRSVSRSAFGVNLAHEVSRCLKLGRNTRSLLFLRAVTSLSSDHLHDTDKIVFAIEASHAASILVDDLLDGDCLRHGLPTTASLWGSGRAALTSHLLTSAALRSVVAHPYLKERLLDCYASMCLAEAHDVRLDSMRLGFDTYSAQILPKTSALFGFSLEAAAYLSQDSRLEQFRSLGELLGEIYQLTNDFHDLQVEALKARHNPWDSWFATASFPIAVFADLHPDDHLAVGSLGKSLSYADWEHLLALIWQSDVCVTCQSIMKERVGRAMETTKVMSLPGPLEAMCLGIIEETQSSAYWFDIYVE